MSAMSDYLEGELIKHIFRTGSFTKPTVLGFALLTTAAVDADTGVFTSGTGVEVTDAGAYARIDRPPLDANWAAPSAGNGLTDNVAEIAFVQATASWGTVAAVAICDNISHNMGNMLLHGTLTESKAVGNNDTFKFPAGSVDVTFA